MKLKAKPTILIALLLLAGVALIIPFMTTLADQDISDGYSYIASTTAEDEDSTEIIGFFESDMCVNYVSDCGFDFNETENIAITENSESITIPETYKYGDYFVARSGIFGRILEDNTPVFRSPTDIEQICINDSIMGIHQGAIFEIISEIYNEKVLVHVSSEGGWRVHNGWYTWLIWIPYDSFELI